MGIISDKISEYLNESSRWSRDDEMSKKIDDEIASKGHSGERAVFGGIDANELEFFINTHSDEEIQAIYDSLEFLEPSMRDLRLASMMSSPQVRKGNNKAIMSKRDQEISTADIESLLSANKISSAEDGISGYERDLQDTVTNSPFENPTKVSRAKTHKDIGGAISSGFGLDEPSPSLRDPAKNVEREEILRNIWVDFQVAIEDVKESDLNMYNAVFTYYILFSRASESSDNKSDAGWGTKQVLDSGLFKDEDGSPLKFKYLKVMTDWYEDPKVWWDKQLEKARENFDVAEIEYCMKIINEIKGRTIKIKELQFRRMAYFVNPNGLKELAKSQYEKVVALIREVVDNIRSDAGRLSDDEYLRESTSDNSTSDEINEALHFNKVEVKKILYKLKRGIATRRVKMSVGDIKVLLPLILIKLIRNNQESLSSIVREFKLGRTSSNLKVAVPYYRDKILNLLETKNLKYRSRLLSSLLSSLKGY